MPLGSLGKILCDEVLDLLLSRDGLELVTLHPGHHATTASLVASINDSAPPTWTKPRVTTSGRPTTSPLRWLT